MKALGAIAMAGSLALTTQAAWAGAKFSWPKIEVRVITADGRPAPNVSMSIWARAPHNALVWHMGGLERRWMPDQMNVLMGLTDAEGKTTLKHKSGRELWPTWRNEPEYGFSLYGVRVPGMHTPDGRPCETYTLDELYEACPELRQGLKQDDVERLGKEGITCKLNATLEQLEARAQEMTQYCVKAN